MSNWYIDQIKFERDLAVGQVVEARWTNNHNYHAAEGAIEKVNGSSVRVKLTKTLTNLAGIVTYPAGHVIVVPRATNPRGFPITTFSVNNGVFAPAVAATNTEET